MNRLYHVFVSSTFADLKEERKKVSEALAKAGYVPEGMELFPASSQKQFDFIRRVIDRCDYYVVIIGGRYGSISDSRISYTEMEYDYALEKKIPTLAFIHKNPDSIPFEKVEKDKKAARKLDAFRDRLKSSAMVDFWDDPGSLATSVIVAVGQEINLSPGIGWIRGDQGIDPRVVEELTIARNRISELEAELYKERELEEKIIFPKNIAPVDEEFTIELRIVDYNLDEGKKVIKSDRTTKATVNWTILFLFASFTMDREDSENNIYQGVLARLIPEKIAVARDGTHRDVTSELKARQIRFQFEALGLIRAETEMRESNLYSRSIIGKQGKHPVIVWRLTEKGRKFMSEVWALKNNKDFVSA